MIHEQCMRSFYFGNNYKEKLSPTKGRKHGLHRTILKKYHPGGF